MILTRFTIILGAALFFAIGNVWAGPSDNDLKSLADDRIKAEAGDPNSMYLLASKLLLNRYGSPNTEEAKFWFEKATTQLKASAERGDTDAMLALGRMYSFMPYAPYAGDYALKHLELYPALLNSSIQYVDVTRQPAYAEAEKWFIKAAESKREDALVAITAYFYDPYLTLERTTDANRKKAIPYYEELIKQDNGWAYYRLGKAYEVGEKELLKNLPKALEYMKKAAEFEGKGIWVERIMGLSQVVSRLEEAADSATTGASTREIKMNCVDKSQREFGFAAQYLNDRPLVGDTTMDDKSRAIQRKHHETIDESRFPLKGESLLHTTVLTQSALWYFVDKNIDKGVNKEENFRKPIVIKPIDDTSRKRGMAWIEVACKSRLPTNIIYSAAKAIGEKCPAFGSIEEQHSCFATSIPTYLTDLKLAIYRADYKNASSTTELN